MDNTNLPVPEEAKKSWGRVREFYEENKDVVLLSSVAILALKNRALKVRNKQLTNKLMDSKDLLDAARIQLEALSIFDQVFGPRKR